MLICLFLFRNGIPAIGEIGITKFLLGQKWKPSNNLYGILPFILGSIYVTAGSIVVGVPDVYKRQILRLVCSPQSTVCATSEWHPVT